MRGLNNEDVDQVSNQPPSRIQYLLPWFPWKQLSSLDWGLKFPMTTTMWLFNHASSANHQAMSSVGPRDRTSQWIPHGIFIFWRIVCTLRNPHSPLRFNGELCFVWANRLYISRKPVSSYHLLENLENFLTLGCNIVKWIMTLTHDFCDTMFYITLVSAKIAYHVLSTWIKIVFQIKSNHTS